MRMMLTSSPVTEIFDGGFQCASMESVIPARTVDIANLAELRDAVAAFVADVRATERVAVVSAFQAPRDLARKVNGFDKATAGQVRVNWPEPTPGTRQRFDHAEF